MNVSVNGAMLELSDAGFEGQCDACFVYKNRLRNSISDCGKYLCKLCENKIWKEVKFVNPRKQDAIVEELRSMLLQRSQTGINKYGVTLDRTDLKPSEWCQHALEETLDFAGYILRLKKDLEKIEKLAKGELGEN